MKLKELIKDLDAKVVIGSVETEIEDIAYHHEKVCPGALFVAIKGHATDGHKYINEACAKGAAAIVSEGETTVPKGVASVIVPDCRAALAKMSARIFEEPSKKMRLVGITGTNGKTTITYILEAIFKEAGMVPGVIGTVEHRIGDRAVFSANTTPESYELQKLLASMVSSGVTACAMEVSSHSLTLERVVGCQFDGAVFTNLTPEHLDFHGQMETYFAAKMRLFRERLVESRKDNVFAAVNTDDPFGKKMVKEMGYRLYRYSLSGRTEVSAKDVLCDVEGIRMTVKTPDGKFECRSRLLGRFNVHNILAAASAALGLGIGIEAIQSGIEKVSFVPGRLEAVRNGRGILAFVDYAHTPDALQNVLSHIRGFADASKGRLIAVFGCGGDRDRTKRPLMGEVAEKLADIVFVTSDNPRTEDPEAIIGEIERGMKKKRHQVIVDRREAIKKAVETARSGDVIIVAGKGHENYQITQSGRRHFDDREVLREFLGNSEN
jgi:UDP-N-acetylmuramoyl-L-alanyl-D-glutamate--2,6-diaminopimelate ligase